jgi:hypothetical protein
VIVKSRPRKVENEAQAWEAIPKNDRHRKQLQKCSGGAENFQKHSDRPCTFANTIAVVIAGGEEDLAHTQVARRVGGVTPGFFEDITVLPCLLVECGPLLLCKQHHC